MVAPPLCKTLFTVLLLMSKPSHMKLLHRLIPVVLLLLFNSCNQINQVLETDNLFKFKEYISYNTHGIISISSPIRVELSKPLSQFDLAQEIPSEYMRITPKIKGKLLVENGRTLVFQPSEYLTPNTEYLVTVKLSKLYEDLPQEFKNYTFSFKTIKTNFKLTLGNLQSYSKQWQYVEGVVETSDLITAEKARQLVTATQSNKNLRIKWPTEVGDSKFFNFTINSIARKTEDSEIKIAWSGKAIKADHKGEDIFSIPGQNNFTVIDIKNTAAPQATLSINFSDPVKEDQNFAGLVAIEVPKTYASRSTATS
jgi:hypothetical protein